jgi:hypothetical protein
LESLAAARPVVATDAGALPEIVQHDRTGLTVPAGDPSAMSIAIERLLEDRPYAQRLAAAGFESARQRYHTPRVLPRILDAYDEATTFYSHVRAAGSERTALHWRSAIDAARAQLDLERDILIPAPTDAPPALPLPELVPHLDVA